jgi:glycerol-3-phosphate dehydrogenase
MTRDLDALTRHTFDVLVIGGGVYGLIIACDAAQRGLAVALIEQRDFGSGSSFNHLRTIHGGLRYLQTADLTRARESIRERRTLARIAPSYLRPLPFVLPLRRSLTRGALAMRAGFALDAILARDRNDHIPASHRLPAGAVIGRDETLRRYPAFEGVALTGAAIWHDYVMDDADRLTFSWAVAAAAAGATLANYVEATALTSGTAAVSSVQAVDQLSGQTLSIACRQIVNATGGAIDRLLAPLRASVGLPMLKAMNLLTASRAPSAALGGRGSRGRNLFMVPWKGRALFGTWESASAASLDDSRPTASEVDAFLTEVQAAFPSFALSRRDVTLVHRGIVPAVRGPDATVHLDGTEHVHEHAASGLPHLISVAGTKYTTARAVAERVTNRVVEKLGRAAAPCRTATTALPVSPLTGDALLAAAAKDEMVVTLEDAVVRRTPLGALGDPGDAVLAHAAAVVGAILGWDEHKRQTECDRVRRFYDLPHDVT